MKRTVLTTVGTSLLTNPDRPWAGWRRSSPFPLPDAVDSWLKTVAPRDACAEVNTWFSLGLFDSSEREIVEVVLLHSQTADGEYCADRLVAFARSQGMSARNRAISDLSATDGETCNRGLRNLARTIGEEIKKGQAAGTVELAATGGFKAEIAVANLVGAVSDTPVHYIYQGYSTLVTIEPIPVTIRADWIRTGPGRALLQAFESADAIVPAATVESLLKQDERLYHLVEIDGSEAVLTLFGEIASRLLDEASDLWPPTSDTAPAAKVRLESAAHHRPPGWEKIVNKTASSPYVTSIRYEGSVSGGNFKEAADSISDLIHRIEGGGCALTLRISTTAVTPRQRQAVRNLLRKHVGS